MQSQPKRREVFQVNQIATDNGQNQIQPGQQPIIEVTPAGNIIIPLSAQDLAAVVAAGDKSAAPFAAIALEILRLRESLAQENRSAAHAQQVAQAQAEEIKRLREAAESQQFHSIAELVDRFLSWPLPETVSSDPCVTVPASAGKRSGTNLLTADEARQMLEHVIGNAKP